MTASSFCEQMCNSEMLVPAFMFLDSDSQALNGSGTVCESLADSKSPHRMMKKKRI